MLPSAVDERGEHLGRAPSPGPAPGRPTSRSGRLCSSARTSTSTVTRPRSAVVIEGTPVSKLAVSVSTIASAESAGAVLRRNAARWPEPTSSSPSTTIFTLSGSAPAPPSQAVDGGDVDQDAGLVVGGAAAEEPAVALLGLEGRGAPQLLVAGRLHVVVGVEEQGGRARGAAATRRRRRGGRPATSSNSHVVEAAPRAAARRWPRRSGAPAPGGIPRTRRWGCAPAASAPRGTPAGARRGGRGPSRSRCRRRGRGSHGGGT